MARTTTLVGVLKGVILKINPDVQIVDITHGVTPFEPAGRRDRYRQTRILTFPPRTIHVVVVDSGSGDGAGGPLLVSGQNQYFIAPDNGVLSGVFEKEEETFLVRHLNRGALLFCTQ